MDQITGALKKASEQRSNAVSPSEESARIFVKNTKESKMHKTWFTWAIVTTTVVAVFVAFNYHGGKDAVPLSEIFPGYFYNKKSHRHGIPSHECLIRA